MMFDNNDLVCLASISNVYKMIIIAGNDRGNIQEIPGRNYGACQTKIYWENGRIDGDFYEFELQFEMFVKKRMDGKNLKCSNQGLLEYIRYLNEKVRTSPMRLFRAALFKPKFKK